MSALFNIQMSRMRVIAVAACLLFAGLMLFAAGTVTGLLMASSSVKSLTALAESAATKPAIEPDKKPSAAPAPASSDSAPVGAPGDSNETAPAGSPAAPASQPAPAASPSSQPAASPAPSSPPAAVPATAPATASSAATVASAQKESTAASPSGSASATAEPSAESSYAIPLAIKVCSFTGKASAEAMITALAAKGYRASLGHSSGAGGRTWYVVKLGPYTEWNTASNVAARVAIAENVRPVIGPMR